MEPLAPFLIPSPLTVERIRPRIILLTCLKVYQKMYEAPSAVAERDKRRKLIAEGESGIISSSDNVGSIKKSAEMKVGLPPQMLSIINMLERNNEVSNNKIEALRKESDNKFETLRRESNIKIDKLKEKVRVLSGGKFSDRNEMHLNAPLAYKMITAFELWREIAGFLGEKKL